MPQLNTADDEYLTVLDALALSPEPVFAVNDRHRIIFWNKAMRRLLGFEYDEVVGKSCGPTLGGRDAFGNRYCSENCAIFGIAQRGESIRPFRMSVRTKSGEPMLVDLVVLKFEMHANRRPLLAYIVQKAEESPRVDAKPAADRAAVAAPIASADPRLDELTPREVEVLGMLGSGQGADDIARLLGISPLTARNHIHKVFAKIEVHSKAEAVAFAFRTHLV